MYLKKNLSCNSGLRCHITRFTGSALSQPVGNIAVCSMEEQVLCSNEVIAVSSISGSARSLIILGQN